jgi:nitroreductase
MSQSERSLRHGEYFSEPQLIAWNISENNFPAEDSTLENLKFMLNYAILAPSSHNTQPWIFKVTDNVIELYADRARALPMVDPDDRALIISCSAALYHLQLAMHHFGYADRVELFPDPENKDLIAKITAIGRSSKAGEHSKDENSSLFYAITNRRTNRSPFEQRRVSDDLLSALRTIAKEYSAWLEIVVDDNERKNKIADLISQGDRTQLSDKRFRRELSAWIHPNRSKSRDGMPGYAHGMTIDIASQLGPFLIRTFDIGKGQAAKDKELATGSPILAILGTNEDNPLDWIRAGQAIAKILLRARVENVWGSFLNQPIEVSDLRPKLLQALSRSNRTGFPQLLVRMGYSNDVRPTPRREVNEVIMIE